ncbi:MAG: hypothetical protein FJZ43_02690 [Candidatus Staskawiczbacteria bacterium]|nr:hypothetical protein [Candidatus Staskawiczbacteria bacterium]
MAKRSKYFFWIGEAGKVATPFWWIVWMFFIIYLPFLRPWWWVFLPLLLSVELKTLYLWWISWDFTYPQTKWVVLEIVPPRESLVPIKAMEDVFATMWGPLFDAPNFRELYCDGMLPECPNWMSLELVSIEGKLHFYIRVTQGHRLSLETALYSYYPDLEIQEVPDYTRNVPKNIPNDEWDIYAEDYVAKKPAPYPIKTYEKFFEPQGEKISAEEKRIDPLNSLLESMSKLGKGEQFWMQVIISSTSSGSYNPEFKGDSEEIINKLTKRPGKKKEPTLFDEIMYVLNQLIAGPIQDGAGEKATYKWAELGQRSETGEREMIMTPGEREILTEVENKVKKPIFRTAIRGMYVAKRENWKASHRILLRTYFGHFHTENMNTIQLDSNTRTKVHYLFRKRRVFLRARKMLKNSIMRFPSYFPDRKNGNSLLSPEELASIFHFPIKMTGMVMPTMEKVEAKKSGPPPNLPVE